MIKFAQTGIVSHINRGAPVKCDYGNLEGLVWINQDSFKYHGQMNKD